MSARVAPSPSRGWTCGPAPRDNPIAPMRLRDTCKRHGAPGESPDAAAVPPSLCGQAADAAVEAAGSFAAAAAASARAERSPIMANVEQTIDVDVPVRVAYDQWTQFESFPRFMDGVDRVVQGDDKTLTWWVTSPAAQGVDGGDRRPDAGQAGGVEEHAGHRERGAVLFEPLGPTKTRITLDDRRRAGRDRGADGRGRGVPRPARRRRPRSVQGVHRRAASRPTGAWRGEIHGDAVEPDPSEVTEPGARSRGPTRTRPRSRIATAPSHQQRGGEMPQKAWTDKRERQYRAHQGVLRGARRR